MTVSAARTIPSIAFMLDVWDGHIFINLGAEPAPLASQLEDLPAEILALANGRSAHVSAHPV